jgi:hypothetical protein
MLTSLEAPVTMASWPARYCSLDMGDFLFCQGLVVLSVEDQVEVYSVYRLMGYLFVA